jgi:capsular exopolysaccharide synthesis family protein
MSKMFDALKKAQGEMAEIGLSLIENAGPLTEPARASEMAAVDPPRVDAEAPLHDARSEDFAVEIRSVSIPLGFASALAIDGANPGAAEQYRLIRTRIVQDSRSPKLLMVSSAGPGDGKTFSAINIACALALRDEANVLLVDADFRRSTVAASLGIPSRPGLSDVLGGGCTLQEAIVRVDQFSNLYVLPIGVEGANPTELLDSKRWRALAASVREHFDFIIVDVPPVAAVADYELIQCTCDGVILVVRPDHTDRTLCLKAIDLIPKEKLIGAVVNCAFPWVLWKTNEFYYSASQA